jgi:hypothetical protein
VIRIRNKPVALDAPRRVLLNLVVVRNKTLTVGVAVPTAIRHPKTVVMGWGAEPGVAKIASTSCRSWFQKVGWGIRDFGF